MRVLYLYLQATPWRTGAGIFCSGLRRIAVLVAATSLFAGLNGLASGDAQSSRLYPAVAEDPAYAAVLTQARQRVEALMRTHQIPGLSVSAIIGERVVWSEGFGYADLENRVPVWPHTKMRAGSVSKTLTSAALGLLHERGQIDLDAPVQRYVPAFPTKSGAITTRMLAGHLAGIRHYPPPGGRDENLIQRHYRSIEEALTIFSADPLMHEPGADYHYSSYGWNLISAVIEGASGDEFLTYMRREVFAPLGLHHTEADHVFELVRHRSRFYVSLDGRTINAPFVDNSYKWAGGGLLSTSEDLARFGAHLASGRLLQSDTLEMLFRSQKTGAGEETGCGIGWFTGGENSLVRVYDKPTAQRIGAGVAEFTRTRWFWHTGGSVGGNSALVLFPEARIAVAMMSNKSPVGRQLLEATALIAAALVEAQATAGSGDTTVSR